MKLPLIFFTLLFFLIVFLRWRASKPKEEKVEPPTEPGKTEVDKVKPKSGKWNFSTAGVVAVIALVVAGIWGYGFVSNYLYPKVAVAPTAQSQQICAGEPDSYEFNGNNKISVSLQPNCWSGWISLPLGTKSFRVKTPSGKNMQMLTWSGKLYSSGIDDEKEEKEWVGNIEDSNFRLRGNDEAEIIVEL